jgi:phytol kinase
VNVQDILATVVAFALALAWLRLMDALAHRGLISQQLSRKLIHIGTGPLFVLCWNLFTPAPEARWLAALVPLAITAQFVLVGIGVIKDPAAVKAMSRTGDPREILRGPLYYGIVFVVVTLVFWRESPVGVVALMVLCGGDGLADVIGRRWGRAKLPWSADKSWAGSAAMLLGSFLFGFVSVMLMSALGRFGAPLVPPRAADAIAIIAIVATAVEAIPAHDIDNVTVPLAAIATAWVLIVPLGVWAVPFWG